MEINKLKSIIEALLFASGESVSIDKICSVTQIDLDTVKKLLKVMEDDYNSDDARGITLKQFEDKYQLCSKSEHYDYIRILKEKKSSQALSGAGLEVLSIVAYNQPVTRSTLEFIRGVNSDGALNKLVELGLVEEAGRLDAPGRPILYATTEEFLRCFGLSSLSELPDVDLEVQNGESL